ncbi:MAG: hypothetical protein HYV04_08615 [Deltaproteobacteria bacterium]|nr:hypothetical protein [Deltaproteobacteria bacterium]
MRRLADQDRIHRFMTSLARNATGNARVYFTGGATAVLLGWRDSTIDVDILIVPEADALLRALPELKEDLQINVELASPAHFIPELPDWQERSLFIAQEGQLSFFHYDLYAQALAKIERGHSLDVTDVREMFRRGLVKPEQTTKLFEEIAPQLYRYPAIDPPAFKQAVEEAVARFQSSRHE